MNDAIWNILTVATAIGSGLIAGVFFAFSNFVMAALARRPDSEGIAAMQAINKTVLNPLFLGLFIGTAGLSAAVIGLALFFRGGGGAAAPILGGLFYLLGTFGATVGRNVPWNEKLAVVDPRDPSAHALWRGNANLKRTHFEG